MNHENEKLRIHFAYWIFILVGLLIIVATDRWSAQPKFTEYLSNAATMTSLVLGLVAIFYSFIANDGLSKSLGNITTVSDEVKQSKEQISKYLGLTQATTSAAKENADAIHALSSDVGSTLQNLSDVLAAIRTETATLNCNVSVLPERLNQLETNVIDATKTLGEKPNSPSVTDANPTISPQAAERFLFVTSLSVNLLTYACVLAKKKNKELSLKLLCEALDSKIESYLAGFLACMDAMQLVQRVFVEGKDRTYSIVDLHASFDNTKEYVVGYIDRAYKDKPEAKTLWLGRLHAVEALFA